MKKSFANDWKMYGVNLYGVQVVPCYIDVARFGLKLFRLRYKLNLINFTYLIYAFRSTFDANIDTEMIEVRDNEVEAKPLGRYFDYGRSFYS
jgi:hypothetical protein